MTTRKRGQQWQADFMLAGNRVRETFTTPNAAEAFELECRAAHKLGKPLPMAPASKDRSGTMKALLEDTALRWKDHKSPGTSYTQARLFVDHTGPLAAPADVLTDAYVAAFIGGIQNRAGATINKRLAGISCLADTAVKQGLIPRKPIVAWRKDTGARDRYYTEDELTLIFDSLWSWHDVHRPLFIFLLDMGCRLADAENLAWADMRDGYVTFRHTKNDRPRTLPMSPRVVALMRGYQKTQHNQAGPFKWVARHQVRACWARLRGVHAWLNDKDCVVHTFRHTCASKLVQGGVELFEVQRWMGHETASMTARYAHLSPQSFGRMRGVLDAATNAVTNGDDTRDYVTKGKPAELLENYYITRRCGRGGTVYTQDLKSSAEPLPDGIDPAKPVK